MNGILVVPTSAVHSSLGCFNGCVSIERGRLVDFIDRYAFLVLRDEAEADPRLKQLIPYIVVEELDGPFRKVYSYSRGTDGGEERLHGFQSIGIGGHIEEQDREDTASKTFMRGTLRELEEELGVVVVGEQVSALGSYNYLFASKRLWLVNDNTTAVGSVHLGIVHHVQWSWLEPHKNHKSVYPNGWHARPLGDLVNSFDKYEAWSQMCIRTFYEDEVRGWRQLMLNAAF